MKRIILLIVVFLNAFVVIAQQPAKTKVPPTIPSDLKLTFFRAQAQQQAAQHVLETTPQFKLASDKQQVLQIAINDLVKLCGDEFTVALIKDGKPDGDGDPTCVDKPKPEKVVDPNKVVTDPNKTADTPKK